LNVIESLNFTTVGLTFITAIILALIFITLLIRLSFLINAVDWPADRKLHKTSTPILGGIAITLSFITCVLMFILLDSVFLAFLVGLLVIFLTGLIDDIWYINPALKFTGEISASLIYIMISDNVIYTFGDLVGTGSLYTGSYAVS